MLIIDALQYVNWTRALFEEARAGGVNAIHVTITYWENTSEALANIAEWERRFEEHSDIIAPVRKASDILVAQNNDKIGIIFGFQNCSPIEDDLSKVATLHKQGVRIMQLTYNNQTLLATGCYEDRDSGVTRMGREVIKEMNRVGMVIDMSHSAELSTLQAIEISERPIAITHANPSRWHDALRNKSDDVLKALGQSGGMLGFSMYPFHLNNGPECTLDDFCGMIMDTADLIGVDRIGIGSDLCQNWGYETLEWMRSGKWTFKPDYGEGNAQNPEWPKQPDWFESSKDFGNIANGLIAKGMSQDDVEKVMGLNWYRFFESSFEPQ
ncbi:MAG: membrane dipeptidase [Acidimicrobiales bacterium]|nr:membrane dipeptidase [Hyphomonadaceae bacterium]RZV44640.1 MAG: membrane dipeptidase [Acidimicrobiales bacterium]